MSSKKKGPATGRNSVTSRKSPSRKPVEAKARKGTGKPAAKNLAAKRPAAKNGTAAGRQASPAKVARVAKAATPAKAGGRPYAIRRSAIHGKGIIATRNIRKGERIGRYLGERITWEEAERRYPVDPIPYHTFLFEIGDGSHCLDGANRGSAVKWINHSCLPNCEAEEDEDERVFVSALRNIKAGEELTYDYNLTCEESMPLKEKQRRYPCWCGAPKCRGTMLGRKRPAGT